MMSLSAPRESELEKIERASRDELSALQLQRLKWSINHAFEHSPMYRNKFEQAFVFFPQT
ncbi:MAG: hypothetical protein QF387_07470 [Arenicellales bacterium]|nr:hypothetical protein [Arenicellales bacterium]